MKFFRDIIVFLFGRKKRIKNLESELENRMGILKKKARERDYEGMKEAGDKEWEIRSQLMELKKKH